MSAFRPDSVRVNVERMHANDRVYNGHILGSHRAHGFGHSQEPLPASPEHVERRFSVPNLCVKLLEATAELSFRLVYFAS